MKLRHYLILLFVAIFVASCSTGKAPINGWHKRDHWFLPSDWHTRNHPAAF